MLSSDSWFFIIGNAPHPCARFFGLILPNIHSTRELQYSTQYTEKNGRYPVPVSKLSKRLVDSVRTISCLMLLLFAATAHCADNNPHIISKKNSQFDCTTCHITMPELKNDDILNTNGLPVDLSRFKQDGVTMCLSCHARDHIHADVAEKIEFTVPADMPLGDNHGHICLTCHYSHGKLDSDQPRGNVNFIDRLFDTERMHKSFLLRRDNSNGGLCLTCHATDDGSKQ